MAKTLTASSKKYTVTLGSTDKNAVKEHGLDYSSSDSKFVANDKYDAFVSMAKYRGGHWFVEMYQHNVAEGEKNEIVFLKDKDNGGEAWALHYPKSKIIRRYSNS